MSDPLEQIKERRRVTDFDLPLEVKTDTPGGPEIHDAYGHVAQIEIPHGVWTCDDELDGCPDQNREAIRRARFLAQAPVDIDWLVGEVERLRIALKQIADDGVEGYESPQKRVALAALGLKGEAL